MFHHSRSLIQTMKLVLSSLNFEWKWLIVFFRDWASFSLTTWTSVPTSWSISVSVEFFFWAPLPDESNCDHRFYFRAPTFFPFGEKWTRGVSNEWPSSALRSVSLAHRSLSFHANPLVSLFFSSVLHVHLRCTEFITDFTGKPVIVLLFGNISIRGVLNVFFVFTFEWSLTFGIGRSVQWLCRRIFIDSSLMKVISALLPTKYLVWFEVIGIGGKAWRSSGSGVSNSMKQRAGAGRKESEVAADVGWRDPHRCAARWITTVSTGSRTWPSTRARRVERSSRTTRSWSSTGRCTRTSGRTSATSAARPSSAPPPSASTSAPSTAPKYALLRAPFQSYPVQVAIHTSLALRVLFFLPTAI